MTPEKPAVPKTVWPWLAKQLAVTLLSGGGTSLVPQLLATTGRSPENPARPATQSAWRSRGSNEMTYSGLGWGGQNLERFPARRKFYWAATI